MSCCQQCDQSGLGALAQFYGLRGLGILDLPPMKAGASFSLGVELSGWDVYLIHITEAQAIEDIRKAVQNTGYVQDLQVYSMAGWTDFNPFIVINGRARYDHGSASHLRGHILSAVGSSGYDYDAGSVRFEADTYDPATGQVHTDPKMRRRDNPEGGGTTPPPSDKGATPPSGKQECKWSEMEFGDYVACVLGIKGAVSGMTAGATGAILGVAVLAAVAVVAMKR